MFRTINQVRARKQAARGIYVFLQGVLIFRAEVHIIEYLIFQVPHRPAREHYDIDDQQSGRQFIRVVRLDDGHETVVSFELLSELTHHSFYSYVWWLAITVAIVLSVCGRPPGWQARR